MTATAALAIAGGAAGSALADTTVGATGGGLGCNPGFVVLDSGYAVPSGGGTINSFSFDSGATALPAGQIVDFLVLRPAGPGSYQVVGKSGVEDLGGTTGIQTYAVTSIVVQTGDLLGFYESADGQFVNCRRVGTSTHYDLGSADPAVGSTLSADPGSLAGVNLNELANLVQSADLSLTKTVSPASVAQGQTVTYSLAVSNAGPGTAAAPTVTDTLPAGQSFVVAGSSPGCSASGQTVTCPTGDLLSGGSITLMIVARAGVVGSGQTDTATVSSTTTDGNPGNNTSTATVNVVGSADLSLTKAVSPTSVAQGQTVTYSLLVANGGPSSAAAPTVTDTLPAGQSFVAAGSSPGCSASGQTVTCTTADLPSGSSITLMIVARAGVVGSGQIDTATVSSTTTDGNPGNNTSTATVNVVASADLSLTKTASPTTVQHGQTVTYSLSVANAGPSSAAAPTVTDTLPAGQSFVAAGSSPGCSASGQTVTCTTADLSSGGSITLMIVARAGVVGSGQTDTATVSSTTTDGNPGNNTSTATVNVVASADLSLTKTSSPSPAIAGQQLTYTLTASNAGRDTAVGAVVVDTLPAGTTFQGASPGCTFDPGTGPAGTVTCPVGNIAPGGSATVQIAVLASAGSAANAAVVSSGTADPSMANNTATNTTTVTASCTVTTTGTVNHAIIVPAGQFLCLVNATVNGSTTVHAGGAVSVTNSTITGGLGSDGAVFVTLCGSTFKASVNIQTTTLLVRVGDDGSDCAPNHISGSLLVKYNTGGVELYGNAIGGPVSVSYNHGASPLADGAAEIEGNHITGGSLACSSNVPPPTNDGLVNTVAGAKLGQCAGL